MGNRGKREFIQVLRLMEAASKEVVAEAVNDAIRLGAIGFDAVKRRHPNKTRHWVVNRYYGVDRGHGWVLCDGRLRLPRHNETRVSRFVKV